MNRLKPLYEKGDIIEVLPVEDCDTDYGPGYVYEMINVFKKNPRVEILFDEFHSMERHGKVFYYYQYKIKDCHGETRYINEDWIRPKPIVALFI